MNLKANVGFDVIFDQATGKLEFPEIPNYKGPSTRTRNAACHCYAECEGNPDEVLYWMYTGLSLEADRQKFETHHLRYDLTVIRPGKIGKEFIKTVGHYHSRVAAGDEEYPEIYEVVYGKAIFLLQDENFMDSVAIEADAGTKVLMPPGYGHITINATSDFLVVSDMVSSMCTSNYGSIKDHKGGSWLYIEDETGSHWIENANYKKHPKLRIIEPGDMPLIFGLSGTLYENLEADPKRFKCLNFPETCATF